jgi:acyl-CoA synthetase (AMP-forming)/AMP-acid ligase II
MKMTPVDALMHQAQTRPHSAAFVFHDEAWTYQRLATKAEQLARGMAARGIGPRDRVALHLLNRPEMIVAYYACFQLGAIAAPLEDRALSSTGIVSDENRSIRLVVRTRVHKINSA